MALRSPPSEENALFREERDLAASVLWASLVYSLVPFLGIVFVPVAAAICVFRLIRNRDDSAKSLFKYLISSIVILLAQLGLWWLLYAVPTLNR